MSDGKYNVLIMGASYGSLLASKLVLAGHNATLVCLPAEAEGPQVYVNSWSVLRRQASHVCRS